MRKLSVIFGSACGNIIEWYDFALYGFMAPILASVFFPTHEPWMALLSTYFIFSISFLMRPVGALIYGYFGDTRGRKSTLMLSLLLMGLPTVALGLLPSYHQVGALSPVLLLIVRLFQGTSAGGEFGGSVTYLVEQSGHKKRGLYSGIAMSAAMGGVFLASIVAMLTSDIISHHDLVTWFWRIPFLASIVITVVGFYFRYQMLETEVFTTLKEADCLTRSPIQDSIVMCFPKIVQVALVIAISAVMNYLVLVYLPAYLDSHRDIPLHNTLLFTSISLFLVVVMCLLTAAFSRHIPRKKALLFISIVIGIISWPISHVFASGTTLEIGLCQMLFGVLEGIYFGILMLFLVELFPAAIRFTSLSFGYNVGFAFFGGMPPLIGVYLTHEIQPAHAFAIILTGAAVCTVIGLMTMIRPRLLYLSGLALGQSLWKKQIEYFDGSAVSQRHVPASADSGTEVQAIVDSIQRKTHLVAYSPLAMKLACLASAKVPDKIKKVLCILDDDDAIVPESLRLPEPVIKQQQQLMQSLGNEPPAKTDATLLIIHSPARQKEAEIWEQHSEHSHRICINKPLKLLPIERAILFNAMVEWWLQQRDQSMEFEL